MPPQPRRSAADEISIGELARLIESQTKAIEEMRIEFKGLSHTYDTKERVDLLVGGLKVDFRRHEQELADSKRKNEQLESEIKDLNEEINLRFRNSVMITFGSLLCPAVIALVVFLLGRSA